MKPLRQRIGRQQQQVLLTRGQLHRRLRAVNRLVHRRAGSPSWLAISFGGGLALGVVRPLRLLITGRLWTALIGAFLEGIRTTLQGSSDRTG